jgi:hypothetical protein
VITGGLGTYTELQAQTAAANCDLVLKPKGTGNIYPLGATLNANGSLQPKIIVANAVNSSVLGAGNPGQVMTSNGNAGAPYWATSPNFYQVGISFLLSTSQVFTGSGTSAISGIAVRYNNLGLTYSNASITNWVANAVYKIDLQLVSYNAGINTTQYFSATASNGINVTQQSFGGGGNVYLNRGNIGSSDAPMVSNTVFWIPTTSTAVLYLWVYTSNAATVSTQTIITRWS